MGAIRLVCMYVFLYKAIVGLYNVKAIEVTCSFCATITCHVLKIMSFKLALIPAKRTRSVQYLLTLQIVLEMCSQLEWTVVVSESAV